MGWQQGAFVLAVGTLMGFIVSGSWGVVLVGSALTGAYALIESGRLG